MSTAPRSLIAFIRWTRVANDTNATVAEARHLWEAVDRPNLMIKAIAERERFPMPTFFRYAALAFVLLLPGHVVTTLTLVLLDR